MRNIILLSIATIFCFLSTKTYAQTWLLSDSVGPDGNTFILDCSNASSEQATTTFLYDSGGPDGDYGRNESFLKKIQAEEGKVIHIKFTEFNLASGSTMTINNPSADFYYAYDATGSSLLGKEFISDSESLSIEWRTSYSTSSGFSAKIWCSNKPQYFSTTIGTNISMTTSTPIAISDIVCSETEIEFTATNTFSETQFYEQNDESLTYNWAIINSANDTTWLRNAGQSISHTFESGGTHRVQCFANDENQGHNINDNTVMVRVYPTPTFNIAVPSPEELCIGQPLELSASPIFDTTGFVVPKIINHGVSVFGVVFEYDVIDNRYTYSKNINVSGFAQNRINSIDDIERIYVNIDHSFLGDVSMTLKCPNNQTCLLKAYEDENVNGINNPNSTNGKSIYLGKPTVAESDDDCFATAGEGYSYYFSPTATAPFGTKHIEFGALISDDPPLYEQWQYCTPTHYTDNCGFEHQKAYILDEGSYATYQSMSSLIGCPINGTWTLTVTDHHLYDYGHVFGWGIYFNEPVLNSYQEDGISWTGEGITDTSATTTSITPNVTENGFYPYTFQLTDNFGCTYDTTINVNVYLNTLETPQIDQIITDSLNHNYITWTAIDNDNIQEYRIYRSSDSTNYELVATIPAGEPTEWTDETTDISIRPYRYCLTAFGGCETAMSQYVESIYFNFTTTIDTDVPQTTSEGGIYAQICQGQSITFTASNTFHSNYSFEHSEESLTYDWTIITGRYDIIVLQDAGQQISRTFDTNGGFLVKCQTHDTHNITNSNDNTINVQVSETPQLEVSTNLDSICSGTEIALTGIVHPQKWQALMLNQNSYSGIDLIPDNGGTQNYSSSIEIHTQDMLETINSTDKIDHININIEHSYLGDLSIMLECPNGQKCLLKAFSSTTPTPMDWSLTGEIHLSGSSGGGSHHLGLSPDPSTSTDPCYTTPGEGWTYSIYPDGTIPFGYSSPHHTINYTDNCNNTTEITVVDTAPQNGQYGPYESMSSLIGCPINGTWKLHVNDKINSDNGFIFGWGIYMFETEGGEEEEWSFINSYEIEDFSWVGNGITTDTTDNGVAIAIPSTTNTGHQEYTFSCTDNFGCTYDTTINVYVYKITPIPPIKSVSTNVLNQNVVEFSEPANNDGRITHYNIFRSRYPDEDSLVAIIPHGTTSWTDMNADPSQWSYSYKVTSNDDCGESEMSSRHRTMHLDLQRLENNSASLNWTHYEGFQYDTYKIYRGENPFSMELIGEVPSSQNSFTDNNTNENNYYQIEISNSENSNIIAKSNIVQSRQNLIYGYEITNFSVFPNPASTMLNITSSETLSSIEIFSATGQSVLQTNINSDNTICDIKHLASGIYLIVGHDSNGKIGITKFTKE